MAIAFQSAITLVRGSGTTVTATGTFTGSNGGLFAAVDTFDVTDLCTGVIYAGQAMTRIDGTVFNAAIFISLWYLPNPSTVASSSLVASFSSSVGASRICGAFYTGAQQTTTMDNSAKKTNAGTTTITGTVTTIADNCWYIMCASNDSGFSQSAGAGTTLRSGGATSDNLSLFDGNAAQTPAGSVSLIANDSGGSAGHGIVIASFALPSSTIYSSNLLLMGVG